MYNVKLAVIEENCVVNIIAGQLAQIDEIAAEQGKQVLYIPDFDLQIGDIMLDGIWTRNDGGVQAALSSQPLYGELAERLAVAEKALQEGANSIDE